VLGLEAVEVLAADENIDVDHGREWPCALAASASAIAKGICISLRVWASRLIVAWIEDYPMKNKSARRATSRREVDMIPRVPIAIGVRDERQVVRSDSIHPRRRRGSLPERLSGKGRETTWSGRAGWTSLSRG
jgi:hypothetical protein